MVGGGEVDIKSGILESESIGKFAGGEGEELSADSRRSKYCAPSAGLRIIHEATR